jgi:hypothetical protein
MRTHWTLTARHFGSFTDAEVAEIERQIEAVLKRKGVLPGKMGEYSILGSFQECYKLARIWAAKGSA